uniref:Uncharacterized protein n=1 Tax=Knipowitschia caucasica TaxID=637954 RepID=A0AAV2KBP6_KNICA
MAKNYRVLPPPVFPVSDSSLCHFSGWYSQLRQLQNKPQNNGLVFLSFGTASGKEDMPMQLWTCLDLSGPFCTCLDPPGPAWTHLDPSVPVWTRLDPPGHACAPPVMIRKSHSSQSCPQTVYMTAAAAAAPMQGTYIPQYTPVPPTAVPVEGVVTDSPQTVAPSSQEVSGQQQMDSDHVPAYSYQSK